jgi:hypothetical protein
MAWTRAGIYDGLLRARVVESVQAMGARKRRRAHQDEIKQKAVCHFAHSRVFFALPAPPPPCRADQIQINALIKWLGVKLTIVSLDAHAVHADTDVLPVAPPVGVPENTKENVPVVFGWFALGFQFAEVVQLVPDAPVHVVSVPAQAVLAEPRQRTTASVRANIERSRTDRLVIMMWPMCFASMWSSLKTRCLA